MVGKGRKYERDGGGERDGVRGAGAGVGEGLRRSAGAGWAERLHPQRRNVWVSGAEWLGEEHLHKDGGGAGAADFWRAERVGTRDATGRREGAAPDRIHDP